MKQIIFLFSTIIIMPSCPQTSRREYLKNFDDTSLPKDLGVPIVKLVNKHQLLLNE